MAKSPAKENTGATSEIIFVGCDDGHDSIKVEVQVLTEQDGKIIGKESSRLSMPSKVLRGSRAISLTGGENSGGIYQAGGESLTITDALGGGDTIDTRSINYPTSIVNRVLVNDSLIRAGLGGKEVRIVTGLPVSDYYKGDVSNQELIDQKRANILNEDIKPLSRNVLLPKIVDHRIGCEGISAVYDMAIRDDGTDDEDFFKLLERAPVGVIDIGGKTVDLAVVYLDHGSPQVDMRRTSSLSYGMLRVQQAIEAQLKSAHGIDDIAPRALFKVLSEKTLMLFGEERDVSAEVGIAMSQSLPDLFDRIKAQWGTAHDMGKIIVVGGGAYLLAKEIKEGLYKHAESRPSPEFANARGMLKLGMRSYLQSLRDTKE